MAFNIHAGCFSDFFNEIFECLSPFSYVARAREDFTLICVKPIYNYCESNKREMLMKNISKSNKATIMCASSPCYIDHTGTLLYPITSILIVCLHLQGRKSKYIYYLIIYNFIFFPFLHLCVK